MNIGSLAINNMFTPNAGTGPAQPKPPVTKNTNQFSPIPVDNQPPANAPETTTTDNVPINSQSKPASKQPQDFSYTLGEKITPQTPRKAQNSTKSEKQNPTPGATTQPNSAETGVAQDPSAAGPGKPQVTNKPAQSLASLKALKFPLAGKQTARPMTSQPENKPLQPATNQSKIGLKIVLPGTSTETLTTDTQSGEGKNVDKTPASNNTIIATTAPASQESGKEPMVEVLTNGGKTATTSPKQPIADTSSAYDSQKTSQSSGKKLMPEALVNDNSKTTTSSNKPATVDKPAVVDKPAASANQKIPVLNDSTTEVQPKSSDSQPTLVGIGLEKSAPVAEKPANNKADANVAEKPTNNKADANQQAQILPESPHGNGKEQGTSLSSNSILKNLNPEQLQISTGQTKDHSSSSSNNSSNQDFEQTPLPNNAQSPIAEQPSASVQSVKFADNAPPSNASDSISEQVQESIYSLLSRGDQQITIRLNPPELGKVLIKFQEQENQIIGLLEVSKTQTRAEIQQALPQIIRNLADCGVQVKRLEVVLTDQSEQQSLKDQSLQGDSFQQHSSTEDNNPNNTSVNEWLTNANSYQSIAEPQEMLITDNSLNMLV